MGIQTKRDKACEICPRSTTSTIDIEHVSSAWSVFGYLALDGYLESAQHEFCFWPDLISYPTNYSPSLCPPPQMYGRYTKDLGEYAKDEARRLKHLERRRKEEDKAQKKVKCRCPWSPGARTKGGEIKSQLWDVFSGAARQT